MPTPRPTLWLLVAVSCLSCAGDSADASGDDTSAKDPAEISYWRDAKPIIDAKCNGCHYAGGVAPFALETYEDVATYGPVARAAIEAGTMPPWHPAEGCRDYEADRSLDDADRTLLLQWFDDGTPEGDPADEGEPRPSTIRALSRVDATMRMATEYTPTVTPDDNRCFVVDWPAEFDTTKYVTGTEVKPGNLGVVHHVLVFHAPENQLEALAALDAADEGPGYECFAGAGVPVSMLGGWAPGGGAALFDDNMGVRVEPGGKVVIQVHYNTLNAAPAPDLTAVDFQVTDSVERELTLQLTTDIGYLAPGGMPIPAGDAGVVHESVVPRFLLAGDDPIEIFGIGMHMHLLGQRGWAEIRREDGSRECLLDIPDWDFDWQGAYYLQQPTLLQPGDELAFGCEFDNSAENQPFVNGEKIEPQYTEWGDGTTDEMCLLPVLFAPVE